MARFCTACGTRNDDQAAFCEECGKPLRAGGAAASVAQGQAAAASEEPAARPASPTQRRSGLVPAVFGGVILIIAGSGYAWWSSSPAANAEAFRSAAKGASAPSAPGRGSAVTVAGPGQGQPEVAQVTTRGRSSDSTEPDRGGIVAAVKNLVSGGDRKTLEGTYVDSLGVSKYQFKDDGTVLWTNVIGTQVEWKYERDGDTIKVLMPYGGYMVLTLRSNGSLHGPGIGMTLTRQQSASSGGENGSGNGASGGNGALAARLSKPDAEAMDLVLAEVAGHYLKTSDGWTTAVSETINPPFTPTHHFLRQYREITPDGVDPEEVGAADRLNGFEWVGEVSFKISPAREAGDPGLAFTHDLLPLAVGVFVYRAKGGGWTQWVDLQPRSVRVVKLNGVWKVPKGSSLLSGQLPTPQDFQRAGVR